MSERISQRLEELGARLDTRAGWDRVRRVAWAVLAAAVLALIVRGGSRPVDPYLSATARVPMTGFGQVAARVTAANGAIADWCALLAATDQQRQRGLMGQTSLNGYDAMVFRYEQPSTTAFWMKSTLLPLTVAYFDADGRFLSAQDMQPCPASAEDCPMYPPSAPYVTAVEVPLGGLGAVGIDAGSTISFPGGPCPA